MTEYETMMTVSKHDLEEDCFGIPVSVEEIQRWNALGAGQHGFFPAWNDHCFMPLPISAATKKFPKDMLLGSVSEDDMRVPLVMEFGCGAGWRTQMALSFATNYIGIDISSFALALAQYRFSLWPQAQFLHTVYNRDEILQLHGTVDGIYGANFFYHQPLERLIPMMGLAGKLLRPGGWLLLELLPEETIRDRPSLAPDDWVPGAHWAGFSVHYDQLKPALEAAGLCTEQHFVTTVDKPERETKRVRFVLCRRANG